MKTSSKPAGAESDVSTLIELLETVVDIQQEHGKLLARLASALAQPPSEEAALAESLRAIAEAIERRSADISTLGEEIRRLPDLLGATLSAAFGTYLLDKE
ncbi:hypothetical protein AA12717_1706 [Gluconacetobacter sacchari DSM 12717]|uniref:Uncharacterized protein n=2 Tax=Gluconacetobacter sacchari TaxID=92759 RepID=A0A7W4NNZ7_9PROT|nr:hypothetical protein [Gluconacetobacter sacchari]MBB2161217.1 hypothetical protein [Gluconacetobacter sacchari]GBQ24147.1 hypothetical protein AA12717_1706 [Gluconacetobacter sacchari DSM 12717]